MEYIFIYGKNPELSLAEILSYLEARPLKFRITEHSQEFVIVKMDNLPMSTMEDLGGTIKIAEVIFSSAEKDVHKIEGEISEKINFDRLFGNLPTKAMFGVSSYNSGDRYEILSSFFKQKMKEYGLSAGYIRASESASALTHTKVVRKKMVGKNIEFVVCTGKLFYLGKTIAVHNPFEFQKRDIGRPVQRTMLSIPPRLSKIMINLSKVKDGILLDAFCGIGAILQEAVLMGFDVRGIDNDGNCIRDCITNLNWLKGEYNISGLIDIEGKVKFGDAKKLSSYFGRDTFDAIVSEPSLGPPLKKRPERSEVRKILNGLEPLFQSTIREMVNVLKPGGRIVIVSPVFMVDGSRTGLDMESIARQNGCKTIDPIEKYNIPHQFPLMDFEERHSTLRRINIIEKPGDQRK